MRKKTSRAAGATPAFVLEQHLFYLFGQAMGRRDRALAGALRRSGLNSTQWRVLAALHAHPDASMNALSEKTAVDRTTLTRTVDRMQADGLLERRQDDADRRARRLRLSEAGERVFARVLPLVLEQNRRAVDGIDAADQRRFRELLGRIIDNLGRDAAG